jgi:hypothetical protein
VGIGILRRGAGRKRHRAGCAGQGASPGRLADFTDKLGTDAKEFVGSHHAGLMRADRGVASLVGGAYLAGYRPSNARFSSRDTRPNVVQSGAAADITTHSYMINLLGEDYLPLASECFEASDDAEAVTIACALGDTCADVVRGCELWRGNELITALGFSAPAKTAQFELARIQSDLLMQPQMRQAKIITLQETFLRLHPRMRASRLLLQVAEERIRHQ